MTAFIDPEILIESVRDNEMTGVRQYHTTMTERGQVTLPAEIRRKLGIRPKDKVTFEVEDDTIRIVPAPYTVESVRSSVPPLAQRRSLEEIYDVAGEEHARHVLEEINQQAGHEISG